MPAVAVPTPATGSFLGTICFVAGGGGIIGTAVCAQLLREGATVIAVRICSLAMADRRRRAVQESPLIVG